MKKILVFEYITGGGLNKAELPESLAKEGLLMLQALLDNFVELEAIELMVMLDYRLTHNAVLPKTAICHVVNPDQNSLMVFQSLIVSCDAVWPIAPESDGVLESLCAQVEHAGKILLSSSASVVAIAGNKWLTYEVLQKHAIPTVYTQKLQDFQLTMGEWIVKAVDGVAGENSFIVVTPEEFAKVAASLEKSHFIVQPHLYGKKTSLSCLFKQGQSWLLSINLQEFTVYNQSYHLAQIVVNGCCSDTKYTAIVNAVAKAMPGLWGYVGIDLIETDDEILVLEINPRLTTSFTGIKASCGINVAELVLSLLAGEPNFQHKLSQPFTINLSN